ncbi:hypothetical protein JCM6882_003022 [Rhodosporidiobolus microsporus]
MSYPDPYGYYGAPSNGYPPPPSGAPYYGGYQPPPPPAAGYPYGAHAPPPPSAGYPPAYPPAGAPYGGYYPPPPPQAQYDYPPPAAHHSPPPPAPLAPAAPPPAREGELRPPPDVGVDPNSFRRFFGQELHKLTYNSKPVITALTLFAHEHSVRMSGVVAQCLEEHIRTCPPTYLLPTFYLLDSISKNIGAPYLTLFSRFLERSFLSAYHAVDSATKTKLEELLGTWKTGAADGGELFRHPGEEAKEGGRVQRGIEGALWGSGGRAGRGLSATTREGSAGYGNGVNQVPHPPSSASHAASPPPAPPAAAPAVPAAATTSERSGVLYDVRRLLTLRQEHAAKVPGDQINEGQIVALKKLESLILNTQLTTNQVNQIRGQLAALAPPAPPPAPTPIPEPAPAPALAPPPAAAAATTTFSPTPQPALPPAVAPILSPRAAAAAAPPPSAAAPNPLAGIDLSLLSQLSATGALANLFGNAPSATPPPVDVKPEIKVEDVKPEVKVEPAAAAVKQEDKADDAAGLWEGEVMRMGVGMANADVALARPQAPNILYTLLPLTCQQCGLRMFDSRHGKRKMDQHLDWHFTYKRRIREGAGRTAGRGWFTNEEDWYTSSSSTDSTSATASSALASHSTGPGAPSSSSSANGPIDRAALLKQCVPVPAAGSSSSDTAAGGELGTKPCPICQDRFKSEWSDEEEEWVWWNATVVNGQLYHATCHAEASLSQARAAASAVATSATGTPREGTPALSASAAAGAAASRKRPADEGPGAPSVSSAKKAALFRTTPDPEAEGNDADGADEPVLKKVKSEPGLEEEEQAGQVSANGMPGLEDTAAQ